MMRQIEMACLNSGRHKQMTPISVACDFCLSFIDIYLQHTCLYSNWVHFKENVYSRRVKFRGTNKAVIAVKIHTIFPPVL